MSDGPAADAPEPESERSRAPGLATGRSSLERLPALDRRTLVLGVSGLALAAAATRTLVRVLANLPFDPVLASSGIRAGVAGATPVVVAAALAAIALTDERATVRVGLLFAGVFGLLGAFVPAVTVPAAVALVVGGALALLGTLGVPRKWTYGSGRRRLLAAGFVLAVAAALASAVGIAADLLGVGASLTYATLAVVGTRSEGSPLAAGAGLAAAAALVVFSTGNPYVAGSALLVAFAATGVAGLLVAAGVAGGVAAVVAGVQHSEYALALGASLLLLAGVPVTFPRAMTVLLGAALVVLELDGRQGDSATAGVPA